MAAAGAARGGWGAMPRWLQGLWPRRVVGALGKNTTSGKNLQAKLDFQKAAYLAELYEMHRALMPVEEIYRCVCAVIGSIPLPHWQPPT